MNRKIAYSRVLLSDGRELRREVVEFDAAGRPVAHYPLCGELPFVEWRDECYKY